MIPGHPLLPRARLARMGIVFLAATLLALPGTLFAELVLTELMAVADENRRDEDGAPSDWLEIANTGSQPQSLLGHYLTNNRNNLTQWEFPDVDIGAGSYLVIYASAKDRTGQELHTSFALDRDGEYLALVAPDGVTVVSEIAPQYPEQFEGVSYGVAPPGNPLDLGLGYFEQPTPGSRNGTVSGPPPAEVVFSETSRMFTEPFSLELSCPTPGAVIRYTTDRTVPGTRSTVYRGPIPVSANTQIRARAFVSRGLVRAVTAHAYLRLANSVAAFSSNLPIIVISSHGAGTPPSTNSTSRKAVSMLFFEPDPETGRTLLTEDPVLATRAGIRRRGSSSGNWPKYSLSVETWRDGDDEDRNIKPLGLAREADWILNARYEWDLTLLRNPFVYEISRQIGRYAPRTRFVEVFSDTSGPDVSNADYFGVYSLIERIETDPNRVDIERLMPWEDAEPEITGGYIFKNDRPDPGEPTFNVAGMGSLTGVDPDGSEMTTRQRSWITSHLNELNAALTNSPSGVNRSTRLHFSDYLDVDSWIDHHHLNILALNIDWGRHSAFFYKDRGGKIVSGPVWDYDRSLGCEDVRDDNPLAWEGGVNAVGTVSSKTWFDSRYPWYGHLLGPSADASRANYPDIRQRHTDRWAELREHEFSLSNLYAVIDEMADEIREAQRRNFSKWRQHPPNGGNFATPESRGWTAEISHMKGWLKARVDWLDAQYHAPPSFNSVGGTAEDGFELVMGSPDGPVYYTTDGSDPRRTRGSVSLPATRFEGTVTTTTLIDESSPCRYHVPTSDALGLSWTASADQFDDSNWPEGTGGIGFESGRDLSGLIDTDVGDEMKNINASCYVRYHFELDDPDSIVKAILSIHSDAGFVAYLNGVEIGNLLKPAALAWDSATTGNAERSGGDTTVLHLPEILDLTLAREHLRDGANVIALHAFNSDVNESDFLIRPELSVTHVVSPSPLVINTTQIITARAYHNRIWSAPETVTLVVSDQIASRANLVISEIMYNPPNPSAEELENGYDDADFFEYLELLNIGEEPLSLAGLQFISGLKFEFSGATISRLEPGERGLLVRDAVAFEFRYGGDAAARIIGEFTDDAGLANGGERLALIAADQSTVQDFSYRDNSPWSEAADGDGASLVLANPFSGPDHGLALNWQPSAHDGGTPGGTDTLRYPEWAVQFGNPDPGSDDDRDQRVALLEFAEGGSPNQSGAPDSTVRVRLNPEDRSVVVSFRRSLAVDGLSFEVEVSDDLENWQPASHEWEFMGTDPPENGTAMFSFRTAASDGASYVRQRVRLME